MSWSELETRVTSTRPNVSKNQYYSDLNEFITKINSIQSKLDTIEVYATADQTGDEIVVAINSGLGMVDFARLNIANGDLSIAKTNGLQAAIDAKADLVHNHAQADVTDLTTDLLAKADEVHTHAQTDIIDLSTTFAGKSNINHQHDHGDCIVNDSGLDDDHPKYLSRISRGAPSDANVLETQITYADGVTPTAMNDVPRIIDILNIFSSGIAGVGSGVLDATGAVTVNHGLGTTSFFITAQVKLGLTWQQADLNGVDFTDDDTMVLQFGTGQDGKEYKYNYIATDNITGSTGVPVGVFTGIKQCVIPANGAIQVSHYIPSSFFGINARVDYSTNPAVNDWKEITPLGIEYSSDDKSFTFYVGSSLAGLNIEIKWLQKIV